MKNQKVLHQSSFEISKKPLKSKKNISKSLVPDDKVDQKIIDLVDSSSDEEKPDILEPDDAELESNSKTEDSSVSSDSEYIEKKKTAKRKKRYAHDLVKIKETVKERVLASFSMIVGKEDFFKDPKKIIKNYLETEDGHQLYLPTNHSYDDAGTAPTNEPEFDPINLVDIDGVNFRILNIDDLAELKIIGGGMDNQVTLNGTKPIDLKKYGDKSCCFTLCCAYNGQMQIYCPSEDLNMIFKQYFVNYFDTCGKKFQPSPVNNKIIFASNAKVSVNALIDALKFIKGKMMYEIRYVCINQKLKIDDTVLAAYEKLTLLNEDNMGYFDLSIDYKTDSFCSIGVYNHYIKDGFTVYPQFIGLFEEFNSGSISFKEGYTIMGPLRGVKIYCNGVTHALKNGPDLDCFRKPHTGHHCFKYVQQMQNCFDHLKEKVAKDNKYLNGFRIEYTLHISSLQRGLDILRARNMFSLHGVQAYLHNRIFVMHTSVEDYLRNANLALQMLKMVTEKTCYLGKTKAVNTVNAYLPNLFMVVANALGWSHRWSVAFKEGFPMKREDVWFRSLNTISHYIDTMYAETAPLVEYDIALVYYIMSKVCLLFINIYCIF